MIIVASGLESGVRTAARRARVDDAVVRLLFWRGTAARRGRCARLGRPVELDPLGYLRSSEVEPASAAERGRPSSAGSIWYAAGRNPAAVRAYRAEQRKLVDR